MNIKKITRVVLLLAAVLGFCGISHAQTAISQTTLSAAVNGPSAYNGTTASYQTFITLASTTGLQTPVLPGTPVSEIYVGREAMGVLSFNSTTGIVQVKRGDLSTQAAPHPSGDMVLVAPAYQSTLQYGGNPQPNGFFAQDPPMGGSCVPSGTPATPWVNVLSGAQALCSTITNTWIPGYVNPLATVVDVPNTAVASATTILPTGPLFHLTGTTPVTTITTPVGCNATAVGGCQFAMIVDTGTASQFGTGGNLEIGAAITTLTGKAYTFIWDAKNSKWVVQG
jgi:hypothetical protein